MEPLEDEFGDIIKKAREGQGFTVAQLSGVCNIPVKLIEDMELYIHRPSRDEVVSIARALGLREDSLYDITMGIWQPGELTSEIMQDLKIVEGFIGSYKVNGYILIDHYNGEAAAFDTANNKDRILSILKDMGLRLKYIFLTHCHFDHTGGLKDICRVTGAGCGIPEGEDDEIPGIGKEIFVVKDSSEFRLGDYNIRALATPGHTPGSTSYLAGRYLFSGDTLFAGSVGRAYSPGGYRLLLRSIKEKILSLDERTVILPGHGPPTTVGEEKMHNPFFVS